MNKATHWITSMLAAVVCGTCLLNACVLRAQQSFSPANEMNSTNRVAKIMAKLGLTADQKAKVEPILQESFDKQHAILESFRGQPHNRWTLRSLRNQFREAQKAAADKLKPILTHQQMKQYLDIRKKMNAQLRQKIRAHRDNPE